MAIHQDKLTQDVIDTARAVGVGRWIEATDPETGEPILDDDFDRVMVLDVSGVDARILSKLIDKRVPSVDGPGQDQRDGEQHDHRERAAQAAAPGRRVPRVHSDRSVDNPKLHVGTDRAIEDAEVVQGRHV